MLQIVLSLVSSRVDVDTHVSTHEYTCGNVVYQVDKSLTSFGDDNYRVKYVFGDSIFSENWN